MTFLLNKKVRPYTKNVYGLLKLRHSCASLLLANDFKMYNIKEWLGHSGIQITIDTYGHLDKKRKIKPKNLFRIQWMLEV